jgi:hypothetical protein
MKFIYRLILSVIVGPLLSISLAASPINDPIIGFESDISSTWQLITPNATSRFFLIPGIATISVGVYTFSTQQPTPGMVANRRVSTHYDGWIRLFQRDLLPDEVIRANATSGAITAYGLNRLEMNNEIRKRVAIEYYFVQNMKGYVVSIDTTESNWPTAEVSFKEFVKLFKLKI